MKAKILADFQICISVPLTISEFLDSYPRVHRVSAPLKNLSINTMNKNFISNLFSQGNIEQDYLSKNLKNLSVWDV